MITGINAPSSVNLPGSSNTPASTTNFSAYQHFDKMPASFDIHGGQEASYWNQDERSLIGRRELWLEDALYANGRERPVVKRTKIIHDWDVHTPFYAGEEVASFKSHLQSKVRLYSFL